MQVEPATDRSLQEYLRAHLIELAARPEPDVLGARLRARKETLDAGAAALDRRPARSPGPTCAVRLPGRT